MVEKEIHESDKNSFNKMSFEQKLEAVTNKVENGTLFEQLSPEEQVILYQYRDFVEEEERKKQEEAKQKEEEEQKQTLKELDEILSKEPEKVIKAETHGKPLAPSKLSEFLAKRKVEQTNKKSFKKGGEIILKGYLGKGYEIIWSKEPVRFVEFKSKNEQGEEIRTATRIVKTKGHLHGTSIPLHICLEGVADSIDPFSGVETNMSAEYINKLLLGQFQSGIMTGMAIKQSNVENKLQQLTPILIFIVIGCMIVLIWMMSQLWDKVNLLGAV